MPDIHNPSYLERDQYKDASHLNERIHLHQRFSTNAYGWFRWVFDQLDLQLVQVIVVMAGIFLAIRINPELGFLFIILPLVPVMLAFHRLVITSRPGSWAFSLSGAMFTAWLLLAVFPLQ